MRLDVVFTPAGLTLAEVAGPDGVRHRHPPGHHHHVRRAEQRRARAILPVASTEEALELAQTLASDDVLPRGREELRAHRGVPPGQQPAGDDRGRRARSRPSSSPPPTAPARLLALPGRVRGPSHLRRKPERSRRSGRGRRWSSDGAVLVVCAGRDGAFALDDAYAAGRLVAAVLGGSVKRRGLNDAALASLDLVRRYGERWERPLRRSRAGRELIATRLRAMTWRTRRDSTPIPCSPPSTTGGSPSPRCRYDRAGRTDALDRRRRPAAPAGRADRAGGGALPRPHTAAGEDHRTGRRLSRIRALAAARRGRPGHSAARHRPRARGLRPAGRRWT